MSDQTEQGPKKTNAIDVHVANRLRLRRLMIGLSQVELGKATGIAMQQVQKYEAGQNRIPAGRLFHFSRLLGVTVGWFFEGLDTSNRRQNQVIATPPAGHEDHKLEPDVVKLIQSYRDIPDENLKRVVRRIAKSLAKQRNE